MNQATQATASTASTASTEPSALDSEREAYSRASELMDRIVGKLAVLPRSAAVVGDLTGFRVQLNFGTNQPRGVLEFAKIADAEVSRDRSGSGVWLEARATIEDVAVRAEVLLSAEAAAAFDQHSPPPSPAPADMATAPQASASPVPLGSSVFAQVPTVTPVQPVPAADGAQ